MGEALAVGDELAVGDAAVCGVLLLAVGVCAPVLAVFGAGPPFPENANTATRPSINPATRIQSPATTKIERGFERFFGGGTGLLGENGCCSLPSPRLNSPIPGGPACCEYPCCVKGLYPPDAPAWPQGFC